MTPRAPRASARILLTLAWFAVAADAHATEFQFHGLLDVTAAERGPAYEQNVLTRGDSPFDGYTLRLFCDGRINDRLQLYSQGMLRDATAPYVDGAYLQFTPWPERDLHLQAGKVPWAIGTYGPRTYSNRNPLVGAPLLYQYHTSFVWYEVVPTADQMLRAAGTGQYGVNYFGYAEGRGAPLVDDCYWDVGATLLGSARPLEYAIGVVNGTPGWGSTSQDENAAKSVLGRVGLAPLPGARFGVSGSYGAYLNSSKNPKLPPGRSAEDYHQILGMADLELLAGHAEFRAEGAYNVWETPFLGDLHAKSGYAELKYTLPAGTFVAGRWDALRFGEITNGAGASRPWDWNVSRVEAGAGYRFNRDVTAKVVWQRTRLETAPGSQRDLSLVAAQLTAAF